MPVSGRLAGKTAIIIGASNPDSMGAVTAMRFAQEGANLILAARREADLKTVAESLSALAMTADVTDEDSLAVLADRAISEFGSLDIAVNYAGTEVSGPISEITPEDLRRSSDVHFMGPILFFKHMAERMSSGKTPGGSLITASSMTAILAPPGYAGYAGAKSGADHAVKIAAVEYGPKNIRVNAIAPGFTKTTMTEQAFEMESLAQAFLNETPLGRAPTTQDIANAALWLASDEAFVTGQIIDVTGGQTLRRIPTPQEMGF